MYKLLIFYYNNELIPVLENADLISNNISDINVISFQDVNNSFQDKRIRFTNIDYLYESILNSDIIWIFDSKETGNIDIYIDNCISIAMNHNKEIIWGSSKNISNELSKYDLLKDITIVNSNLEYNLDSKNELLDIDTPIVFILGLSENTNKYATLLKIHKDLKKNNFDVYSLSARNSKDFNDINILPKFIYDKTISLSDKILLFNHYIYMLEKTYKPEIILIEIPGGFGVFSKKLTNNFGEFLFIASNALLSDFNILNIPLEDYNQSDFDNMNKFINNRFNLNIDIFNIIPKRLCFAESERTHKFSYLSLDNDIVDKFIEKFDNNQNIFNDNNIKVSLANEIIKVLTYYSSNNLL
ncbi:TIGR04066 family peptide maturation system protein [Peptacetobacter hominis]|uniref:TIGR04066 family peptide maturation system protein n=1 Tax=Peptacetobacter hominis TaxID=2743610 RepID=A0A544QTL9_9FIRM|nr:TIGR04066 family peptide maturation system protein [Peptacetobacter hominis]TQQ84041.1 TIGR04066 family peptide maturation system protein [Peptacetobacter hominis]